jgi:hypothetical protein
MVALFGIYRIVMSDMPFCCQRKAVSFLEKGRFADSPTFVSNLPHLGIKKNQFFCSALDFS